MDNSIDNQQGRENYFDAQIIPPYAHSFLLSGVLSADYVDKTGDGITDDDTGNAIKFNYSRFYDPDSPYKWRVPIEENHARYQAGYTTSEQDDKASYLYGEKEIWYLHSMESRTMLALFYTSPREDALGVQDENGGKSTTSTLQKLDSIQLYSKADTYLITNHPKPIKTVHFEYDYSLCGQVPNHQAITGDGKLTLKKIYFTYGTSRRGMMNAYSFNYSTENPNYNISEYDRWGSYKAETKDASSLSSNSNYPSGFFPTNKDFPYVLQDTNLANKYAKAWNLTEINLPSGGKINVEYEADDYAYVQNKRAGQMFFIEGFADNPSGTGITNQLYQDEDNINAYAIVRLEESLSTTPTSDYLKERYFGEIKKLFFKCNLALDDESGNDYIEGYMDYVDVSPIGTDRMAIQIKLLGSNTKMIHPITRATLQTMRLNLPELVYPGYDNTQASPAEIIKGLLGIGNEIANLARGFERNSMQKEWAKYVDTNKTWIRLSNPNYKKLGGGSRVKKIAISDEWSTSSALGTSNSYGQTYTYETTNEKGETISSGVASYEPFTGGEENALRQPLPYPDNSLLVPSYFYTEAPICENLYPSPVVGYSKVKVQNIAYGNVNRTATGYTLNEYYTAKDFPVLARQTPKIPKRAETSPIANFFKLRTNEEYAVSQGFAVELNDMHGKMKKTAIYNEKSSLISSTEYKYKTATSQRNPVQTLESEVLSVQADGSIQTAVKGLEIDMWQDMQEEFNSVDGGGVRANLDASFIIPIPTPYLNNQLSKKRFLSAVTTKLVKRSGILDKVIVTENGSTLTTENVLFDSETGQVLLTKTQNEFDDDIYQFTYPAHWAYEGMEQAYQNIGAIFENTNIAAGAIDASIVQFFHPGDEVIVFNSDGTSGKYFVTHSSSGLYSGALYLKDENGSNISPVNPVSIKIIRSGHRNQALTPIASVMSKKDPSTSTTLQIDASKEVLEASATTFNNTWQVNCDIDRTTGRLQLGNEIEDNPYPSGFRGNWRPRESFVFYHNRVADNPQTGGFIQDFFPFWEYDNTTNEWQTPLERGASNADLWTRTNTVTTYDDRGNALENIDAIGVYSAAFYGYDNTRVTAIASNAKREEISSEGFEDYLFFSDCYTGASDFGAILDRKNIAFDWFNAFTSSTEIAHTGKFGLQITPSSTLGAPFTNYINMRCGEFVLNTSIFDRLTPDDPECYHCMPQLYIEPGKEYWMSIWVATGNSLDFGERPSDEIGINLKLPTAVTHPFEAETPVIDGWQKMVVQFTMPSIPPADYDDVPEVIPFELEFTSSSPSILNIFIDDFRFHPFLSNMKSYVYDPFSLRLLAELDENNYATIYEYDDEGILVRVKRETEKGIVTVQESRTILRSNN